METTTTTDIYTPVLLTYIVDTYRATYPDEQARIARAGVLVEAGHVTLLPDGTATVRSQKGQATYMVNGHCTCFDLSAKQFCKHHLAKTFARKLACLIRKARYALYLDAVTGEQVPGIAWPSLDGEKILYCPEADVYKTRMFTCEAAELVLLNHLDPEKG